MNLSDHLLPSARVHQLIMGAGKTTVIGPLLALLFGTNESLIIQVVPQALLEFSRSVMRECFSSSIFSKSVYTFEFNRLSEINVQLLKKLNYAKVNKNIICTTPTCIKSFFLKLLESMHLLDNQRILQSSKNGEIDEGHSFRGALQRTVFGYSRPKKRILDENERFNLQKQLEIGKEILKIFQFGKLILDEVDLILHPSKSELNWPIGIKLP